MTSMWPRRAALLPTLITLSIALAGCASELPTSAPVAEPASPAPSASPSIEPLPAPQPTIAVTCQELVPAGLGSGLLAEKLAPLSPSEDLSSGEFLRPDDLATVQARGITCSTSNGEPRSIGDILNPAWVSIQARVLPLAAAEFAVLAEIEEELGDGTDSLVSCSADPGANCYLDLLVGQTWVTVDFYGMTPGLSRGPNGAPSQIIELAEGIREIVAAAPPTGAEWTVPADTVPIDFDCAVFFGPERIQADFEVDEPVYIDVYEDYISSERTARELAPALSCPWSSQSRRDFGGHSVLDGGEWAFRQLQQSGAFDEYDSLALANLTDDDDAVLSCSALAGACVADAAIGRHWVQMQVFHGAGYLDEDSARAEVTALLQTAVDKLRVAG